MPLAPTRSRVVALFIVALSLIFAGRAGAQAVKVELQKTGDGWSLLRDGKPYFIQGAGGDASKQLLKDCGGNSFRTWGSDGIDDKLAEAQKLGLTVTVGIWLGHENQHFDYNDDDAVAKQLDRSKQAILKYKDNPAVLAWDLGNEMEGYAKGDNPKIWKAVQDIAALAHQLDPNHPTMTTIAEIGGERVSSINKYCPDIDIIGINSYGGGPSLAKRYRAAGGTKPFVVTEFGPAGTWETDHNAWGAPRELTSTAKADGYRATYEKTILAEKGKFCLGSYVFAWGAEREATATWFGLFLADGTRLESIDTLTELWSGPKLTHHCPQIQPLTADQSNVEPGATVQVALDVKSPDNSPMTVKWSLQQDPGQYNTGGETLPEPVSYDSAIVKGDLSGCELKMPTDGGGYWLYATVYDDKHCAAVADIPLHVNGPPPKPKAHRVDMPFVLYGPGANGLPYVWSGWMAGDMKALGMDEKCATNPHVGDTCMKCEIKTAGAWGGIIWQNPANDWGDQFGGFDLSKATKLTFWARGEEGDEVVTFKFGVIGKDKPFHDSDSGAMNDIRLTKDWKQYTIDLAGKDMSCIKTGFGWVLDGAHTKPVTFYISEIKYE